MAVVAGSSEAGGAALDQVLGLSIVGLVVGVGMVWIGYLHRARRITFLTRLADAFGRRFKRPPWEALPVFILLTMTLAALFGFIWDVSLHIGK